MNEFLGQDMDYFKEVYDWQPSLIPFVLFFIFATPTLVLLLYSIIWFEHFGCNSRRTIVNRLVSGVCWTMIKLFLGSLMLEFSR